MKKTFFRQASLLSLLVGILSSCSLSESSSGSYSYREGTLLSKRSVSSLTYHDFFYQSQGGGLDCLPGTGSFRTLVLPIEFSDYPFSDSFASDLEKAFNGKAEGTSSDSSSSEDDEDTGYWESVQSFYETSSFGKLTLTATIADSFEIAMTAEDFMEQSPSHSLRSTDVLREAVANYKTVMGDDCRSFDSDGNGFLDAVYLIYSCPDYTNADYPNLTTDQKENYWAYTSWDNRASANALSPAANAYTWASEDFIYKGVEEGVGVDAHTYIHETGHLLGLDDYYSYAPNDDSYTDLKYKYYEPTGGLDMMDCNILDHNMWSKFALGWAEPYVLDADSSYPLTVELKESQSTGDFLLIPEADSSFNGTAFGEYMMVELYTPDGLNALDAGTAYGGNYPRGFSIPGVKITHVDSRLAHFTSSVAYDYDVDPSSKAFLSDYSGSSSYYRVGASNTPSKSTEDGYRLLHVMEANGTNTFANLDYEDYQSGFWANNGTLFEAEEGRDSFTMEKFASFFENQDAIVESASSSTISSPMGLFNDGHPFGYEIFLNGIREADGVYEVSLTIEKA
jgi:M6 family metalloprotease-like protein